MHDDHDYCFSNDSLCWPVNISEWSKNVLLDISDFGVWWIRSPSCVVVLMHRDHYCTVWSAGSRSQRFDCSTRRIHINGTSFESRWIIIPRITILWTRLLYSLHHHHLDHQGIVIPRTWFKDRESKDRDSKGIIWITIIWIKDSLNRGCFDSKDKGLRFNGSWYRWFIWITIHE